MGVPKHSHYSVLSAGHRGNRRRPGSHRSHPRGNRRSCRLGSRQSRRCSGCRRNRPGSRRRDVRRRCRRPGAHGFQHRRSRRDCPVPVRRPAEAAGRRRPVTPVPAVPRTMPEEDGPEHHRRVRNPVIPAAVLVIAVLIGHRGRQEEQDNADHRHRHPVHPDAVGRTLLQRSISVAEAALIDLVHPLIEAEHAVLPGIPREDPPVQLLHKPVGKNGGKLRPRIEIVAPGGLLNVQDGVALSQAHLGPGVQRGLLQIPGPGALHIRSGQGHHAVIALLPVGIIVQNGADRAL